MDRRAFLRGLAGLAGLAGCVAPGPSDRTTTAPDLPYPSSDDELDAYEPTRTDRTLTLGSREGVSDPQGDGPHDLVLWNAVPTTRSVALRIRDRVDDETVHSGDVAIPGDAELRVRLLEPGAYVVEMHVPSASLSETLGVPRAYFDCNASRTEIGLFAERIDSRVFTTLMACSDRTVSGGPSN
ncbi:MAG: hypothetical protein ABEJ77_07245 [Halanaeroarchaeum sp.]